MRVARVRLRDFRSYASAEAVLGPGITIVHGPNGAGKTNLLEAIYLACTGRSCRTSTEREMLRFGTRVTRVEAEVEDADGRHELSVGLEPGAVKRFQVDGATVPRMVDVETRPLVSVFMPDRLELIKGTPALRRAHLDAVVAGRWPARRATRRAFGQALAQRNALLARINAGRCGPEALEPWDVEMAGHGIALMADRAAVTTELAPLFAERAAALGLAGEATVAYRPRSDAADAEALAEELRERRDDDLRRGFTGHGPHRDELAVKRDGRDLRAYGSQGEQRLALLALLLAERDALGAARGAAPLLLLDDVMSELDGDRRRALVDLLLARPGQAVIATTDVAHVPGAQDGGIAQLTVRDGTVEAVPRATPTGPSDDPATAQALTAVPV